MRGARWGLAVLAGIAAVGCSPRLEQGKSGTRLRAHFVEVEGDRQAVRFETFRDLELDVDCLPTELMDGGFACVPTAYRASPQSVLYEDAACQTPVVELGAQQCEGCNPAYLLVTAGSCAASTPLVAAYRMKGSSVPGRAYALLPDGGCEARVGNWAFLQRGEPLPLDAFVPFSIRRQERGALTVRRLVSPGGAEYLAPPAIDGDVEARPEVACGGEPRWLPLPTGMWGGGYAESACSTRAVSSFCEVPPRFSSGVRQTATSCFDGATIRSRVGRQPVTPFYGDPNHCAVGSVEGAFTFFPAEPVPDTFFPEALEVLRGSGRVRVKTWSDESKLPIAPAGTFLDTTLQLACAPAERGAAGLRCVPSLAEAKALLLYRDAACLQPVAISRDFPGNVLRFVDSSGTSRFYAASAGSKSGATYYEHPPGLKGVCAALAWPLDTNFYPVEYALQELADTSFEPLVRVSE